MGLYVIMSIPFDKHTLINTVVRLPIDIDSELLRQEIETIPAALWGEIRSIVHSDVDAMFVKGYPPLQKKPDDEREILATLPYLRKTIYETIPSNGPGKCVIAKLKPNGIILMHRDGYVADPSIEDTYFYDYFSTTLRIHIPVTTNEKAVFFCHNQFFHLPANEVWTVNNLSDHGVINDHPTEERIHIIVDLHPNEKLLQLVKDGEQGKGWDDRDALARLMEDSTAPPVSPYAKGKTIPN